MMASKSFVFRFDDVEVREREFSLTKAGELLTIEPKAFRALLFLLHNPQKLVRKEELLHAVWGDTAVTDGSLTRCIWLLRNVLGEDTRNPRYIETVPTVGYRFIAPVEERVESSESQRLQSASDLGFAPEALSEPGGSAIHVADRVSRARWPWIAVVVALASLAALGIAWWRIPRAVPVVESITQLTDDGEPNKANLAADRSRIYFNEGPPYAQKIAQVSVTGGTTSLVETNLEDPPIINGVAPNGSELLVAEHPSDQTEPSLWSIPLPAGEPRRLVRGAWSADFLPNGRILFSKGADVFTADRDASNPVKIATLPADVGGIAPSPDGRRVRVGVGPNEIFEMAPDGSDPRKVLSFGLEGNLSGWSPDPRYYLYLSKQGARYDIWALPTARGLFRRSAEPIRLTTGPLSFLDFTWGRDGKQIFAVAAKGRGQLVRYDIKSHEFMPLLGGISATNATFSRDGGWVAYTTYPDHALWRSRSDGSKRMQLTYPPMEAAQPSISPDGTRVAFRSDLDVYVIDIDGGEPQKVVEKSDVPAWSPDSNFLLVSIITPQGWSGQRVVDLKSRKITLIPRYHGQWGGFWLSDGLLAASSGDSLELMKFDLKTGKWSDLLTGNFLNWVASPDHKYLYFATGGSEPKIERLRIADHQVEAVASLKGFLRVMNFGWTTLGVAPDGSPVLTREISSPEIYALNVRWP
jgi:DNA-binding winged helix-turn-helix (wHTH) protein/Tol biopolymer transport system component